MQTFIKKSRFNISVEKLFLWHKRDGALLRLTPPWEKVKILTHDGIKDGGKTKFITKAGLINVNFTAEHIDYQENKHFKDIQIKGPFTFWEHNHLFEKDGENACFLEDRIKYSIPFYPFGDIFGMEFIQKKIKRMFDYRHRILQQDIKASIYKNRDLNIVISGASGLLGSALIPFLTTQGHKITKLVRRGTNFINIDDCLNDADAVIHLAGEPIGDSRWTVDKKKKIIKSRVEGTKFLADKISQLKNPPKILICASAIGYYGNRGDKILCESDNKGDNFVAKVCFEWEKAADAAVKRGIRVVFLRIGVVFTPSGGALLKLLLPFNLGLGGTIGDGSQYMSWIAIDDIIGAINYILFNENINGPVNLTAPNPVKNKNFVKSLSKILKKPANLNISEWFIENIFGQMGKELLLSSSFVMPQKLLDNGYDFYYPDIEKALSHLLGR